MKIKTNKRKNNNKKPQKKKQKQKQKKKKQKKKRRAHFSMAGVARHTMCTSVFFHSYLNEFKKKSTINSNQY